MIYAFAHAPTREVLEGTAITTELYIEVHWYWIILPLLKVTMSMAFLMCTVIHTHRKGVTIWKSSRIVPLLTIMVGWHANELKATSWRDLEQSQNTCVDSCSSMTLIC